MATVKFDASSQKQEIRIDCLLNAPLPKVYAAFVDAKSIPLWWGPSNLTTQIELQELTVGGRWRFVQHDSEGNEFAFHGVYHEVVPEQRIVQTFEWESMPGHVLFEIITFTTENGQTHLSEHPIYQSVEDRDGMVQAGMEAGLADGIQRLEALARKLS